MNASTETPAPPALFNPPGMCAQCRKPAPSAHPLDPEPLCDECAELELDEARELARELAFVTVVEPAGYVPPQRFGQGEGEIPSRAIAQAIHVSEVREHDVAAFRRTIGGAATIVLSVVTALAWVGVWILGVVAARM